jgi:hypothetical protein
MAQSYHQWILMDFRDPFFVGDIPLTFRTSGSEHTSDTRLQRFQRVKGVPGSPFHECLRCHQTWLENPLFNPGRWFSSELNLQYGKYLKMLVWFVCQLDDEIPSGQNLFFPHPTFSKCLWFTQDLDLSTTPQQWKLLAPPIAGCQLEICGKSTTTCKQWGKATWSDPCCQMTFVWQNLGICLAKSA